MIKGEIFAKVAVELRDHPKAMMAGAEAMGVWTWALLWSRAKETDGIIPLVALGSCWGGERAATRGFKALEKHGLAAWNGNGWTLSNYSQHNETKADIDSRRRVWRDRQAKSRVSHAGVTRDTHVMSRDCLATDSREQKAESRREIERPSSPDGSPEPTARVVSLPTPEQQEEKREALASIGRIFERWSELLRANDPDAGLRELTPKRRDKIKARLRTYGEPTLLRAVEGIFCSQFHLDNGFTDIASCFGSDEKVDQHLARRNKAERVFVGGSNG